MSRDRLHSSHGHRGEVSARPLPYRRNDGAGVVHIGRPREELREGHFPFGALLIARPPSFRLRRVPGGTARYLGPMPEVR